MGGKGRTNMIICCFAIKKFGLQFSEINELLKTTREYILSREQIDFIKKYLYIIIVSGEIQLIFVISLVVSTMRDFFYNIIREPIKKLLVNVEPDCVLIFNL